MFRGHREGRQDSFPAWLSRGPAYREVCSKSSGGEEAAGSPAPQQAREALSRASVTMGEASPLRSWDLTATSRGQGLQRSPAGSSKANLPSAGIVEKRSGGRDRGLRERYLLSIPFPRGEQQPAQCALRPLSLLCLSSINKPTQGSVTSHRCQRDMLQHWPSELWAPATSGCRALALPGPHT